MSKRTVTRTLTEKRFEIDCYDNETRELVTMTLLSRSLQKAKTALLEMGKTPIKVISETTETNRYIMDEEKFKETSDTIIKMEEF